MNIASNIKELRQLHNLTQTELGKIAGVSDKAVSTWENGTAEPRIDTLNTESQITGSEQKLIDIFRELNEEGKYELLKQARLLNSVEIYKKESDIFKEA